MDSKKEKLLKEAYSKLLDVGFGEGALETINQFIDDDVMGYGTAQDEKIMSIKEFRDLIINQRKQAINFDDFRFTSKPVINRISDNGNSAVIVDEIVLLTRIQGEVNELVVRMSTVFEFRNRFWKLIHWHGSKPEHISGGDDPWHVNEWKRKNEELQKLVDEKTSELFNKNKELEIEASLERVRAVAMSMHKSNDLLSICEVSFKEFQKLGFENIRNAIIHIPNDQQKYFMDYDFSEFTGEAITKIEYGSHPIVDDYLEKIRSAKDAYFEVVIDKDQLEGWKDFRKKSGQMDDPRLDEATAIYYYVFSIGVGDIGISTFKPIEDSQKKILKRFRNVFDLAYRRYNDIAFAEVQAREARIETALEKIRSRALAMRNSSEVGNVSTLLFSELEKMDINPSGFSIMIFDEEQDKYELWRAKEVAHQGAYETFSIKAMFDKFDKYVPGFGEELKSAWAKGDPFSVVEFRGEKRVSFLQANREMANYSDEDFERMKKDWPDPTCWHLVFFKYGWFGVLQNEQLIKEDLLLIQRFAEVFDFAYTRFLDLQKAEAQAREAQIELALERVRAKSLAMQQTSELQEVVNEVAQQLLQMKIDMDGGVIIIINDEVDIDLPLWGSAGAANYVQKATVPYLDIPIINRMISAIKKRESFLIERYTKEEKDEFMQHLFRHHPWDKVSQERKNELLSREGGYCRSMSISRHTSIAIINHHGRAFSEADNNIIKRFGNVLEQSYTRFLDLQKAETQTREAQIEASLERVRSKAMSMHSPDDLSEAVNVFFKELKTLGIVPIRCGVGQIDEATRTTSLTTTTSSQQGESFKVIGKVKQTGHPVLDGIFDHWKLQKEYHPVLEGENIKAYYNVMNPQIGYPEYPEGVTQYGNNFFFKEGFVFAWTENLLSEEELIIFRRFTSVLSLTYRRYMDLKEAEEKNKIIQADNDRKTKELEDARQLQLSMLPKELPQLPHLDIAVHMRTATEVGGDYYDFNVDADGTLTVLVGDATGHGMMSGMMVSIMKSFFISNRKNIELKRFFENSNNSIKDMHLGRLMMATVGVQITSQKIIATNAGMPSLLYFRNKSKKAGEFVSHNFPLGAMKNTNYSLKEIRYEKGDTLLLMSDGFAELKNEKNEQYGYERVKKEFMSIAQKNPNEIVEYLKTSATQWINGVEPDDDVTFVIIKVK